MNRQKELAVNTIILTVGKICTQFVSFLLLPLYTALLTPDEYGIVDLFNTYITLLVPVFNWQFESGLFRFMIDCRDNKKQQTELFSTVFLSNIFQSCIYILFFFVFQRFIHSEYKIFLAVDVVLNIFLNTMLQLARGLGKNLNYSIASFLSAVVSIALNIIFIAGLKMGAYGMFLASVLAKPVVILYLWITLKTSHYLSVKAFNKKILKKVSKYSIPLIPNQLSWWVVGVSDRTILSFFLGVAANGIYSVANKFSSVFITFYNIFNLSWTESVSLHIKDEDREEFLADTINSMFRLFSAINIGIIACMPFIYPFFIDAQYAGAYNQIPILMLAVLFQVIVGLYSVIYVALKKSTEIAKTSFYAAVVNIGVDLALVSFIGIYAASISTLVAYAVMAVYRYFHVKKYVDISLDKKSTCMTAVMYAVTLVSYYYNHVFTNILVLLAVVIYAYFNNKQFLHGIFNMVLDKLQQLRLNKN